MVCGQCQACQQQDGLSSLSAVLLCFHCFSMRCGSSPSDAGIPQPCPMPGKPETHSPVGNCLGKVDVSVSSCRQKWMQWSPGNQRVLDVEISLLDFGRLGATAEAT